MKNLLIILCFVLIGCEPEPLPLEIENLDIIIIDPSNKDFYKLNHASNSGMGWEETKNGIVYSYYFECETVFITSYRTIKAAYKIKSPGKELIEVKENVFKYLVKEKTTFRIYY